MEKDQTQPLLASKKIAAQALGVSARTIDYLIAKGELRTKRIGRRRLIPWRVLEQFVKSGGGQ